MDLTEPMKYWADRLGLGNWYIYFEENCSPNNMKLDACAGEAEWDVTGRNATIRIIDPKDYGDRIVPFDREQTLVHELLHIKFSMLDESGDPLRDKLTHQMIDDLAKALVRAKRDGATNYTIKKGGVDNEVC